MKEIGKLSTFNIFGHYNNSKITTNKNSDEFSSFINKSIKPIKQITLDYTNGLSAVTTLFLKVNTIGKSN